MDFKPNKEKLLPYYQTVRQTIQGLDSLITDILTKGATATVAIVVGPIAIFKTPQGDVNWQIVFFTSLFGVLAALYVLTAVALYADLLRRAVKVGTGLEEDIFNDNKDLYLTGVLEHNPFAGGKLGTVLYLGLVIVLYLAAGLFSTWYLHHWQSSDWLLVGYFTGLVTVVLVTLFLLHHGGVISDRHSRILSYLVLASVVVLFVWITWFT